MSNTVLGLDVGPNSIGWALVDEEGQKIVDIGVRIFPEGVDNFDTKKEKSRNEDRRLARGMRRQVARRARRKVGMREALASVGLLPDDRTEQDELLKLNPYQLRSSALQRRLKPHELGRALLHLAQRRGFLSNRKRDRSDDSIGTVLAEINVTAGEMKAARCKTLGEFLWKKLEAFDHANRVLQDVAPELKRKEFKEQGRVRRRHLYRQMLEDEFQAIWDAQAQYHPELLTERLKYGALGRQSYPCKPRSKPKGMSDVEAFGLHGLIFFQRNIYWPKSVVGLCELEPKQKRCPRADRHAQRFRLLQEINNLRYIDPDTHEECRLTDGQREMLRGYLATRDKATFDQIRKKLGFLESVKFNLERGKRSSIKGMVTDHAMARAVGKAWHRRHEAEKDAIVRLLLEGEQYDAVERRLVDDFAFSDEQAKAAISADLRPAYANLSLVAIDKLLPHLEKGLVYQSVSDPEQSAIHAAGYHRRDELRRRLFDRLPDPRRARLADCPIGDIPNPVVKRSLVELRKVVNALIRQYGRPDAVHVEMARSVRMGPKARADYNALIHQRAAERDAAAAAIRELPGNIKVSRDGILRYLLWKEQNHECIYCGKPISQQQLFGGEVDVDHILPYSRCLDDSQGNKAVCHRACNHDKGQQTPYEWLAGDPNRYERICQHAGSLLRKGAMPYSKYRKFLQKELDLGKFIARQLTDTGYIARATVEYVRCLFERAEEHAVLGLKGQTTATLRHVWGLGTLLSEMPDSPAWQEQPELAAGEKNRADHRHHAVDALVVALTNRSRLQQLSLGFEEIEYADSRSGQIRSRRAYRGDAIEPPWDGFRDQAVASIEGVNVSHRVERRVTGALHEDTMYGPTDKPGVFVVRKPLESLSPNEVALIRDATIRAIVEQRLRENGIEIGRGKKPDSKKWREALCNVDRPLLMRSGVPIKKVRVLRREQTIQPIRGDGSERALVKPGSTHHLCIFEWEESGKTKRDAEFTTMLEAVQRVNAREPLIRRHIDADKSPNIPAHARFVMSLSRNEMVLADIDGLQRLLVFNTAASTTRQMAFFEHTDARPRNQKRKFTCYPGTLRARKVTVDPLGRIRWAND